MFGFVIVKCESYRNCLNTAVFMVYIINYLFLEAQIHLLKIKCTEFGLAYRIFKDSSKPPIFMKNFVA